MYIKITNQGEDSISFVSWTGDSKVLYPTDSVVLNEPWGTATKEYYAKLFRGTSVSLIAPYEKVEVISNNSNSTVIGSAVKTVETPVKVAETPEVVVNTPEVIPTEETTTEPETISDEVVEEVPSEEVVEQKPLKAMNVKELYDYAEANGIELEEGLTKRQLIQELSK